MTTLWWISCNNWTARVISVDGVIMEAVPIVRRFLGQPVTNLLRWGAHFGGLHFYKTDIKREEEPWTSAQTAESTSKSETGPSPAPASATHLKALSGLAERRFVNPKR